MVSFYHLFHKWSKEILTCVILCLDVVWALAKKEIFMIFCATMLKKSMTIRKTENVLNDCKVNVSCYHLCYEETIETLTCVILGSVGV